MDRNRRKIQIEFQKLYQDRFKGIRQYFEYRRSALEYYRFESGCPFTTKAN
jgi:hypothetical protein